MVSKKTSAVWHHFVAVDNGRCARCKQCGKTVFINASGSTGNLFRHMKLKHPSLTIEKRNRLSVIANDLNTTIPKESKMASNEGVRTTVVHRASHTNSTSTTKPSVNKTVSNSNEAVPIAVVQASHTNSTDVTKPSTTSENTTVINSAILPKFPCTF